MRIFFFLGVFIFKFFWVYKSKQKKNICKAQKRKLHSSKQVFFGLVFWQFFFFLGGLEFFSSYWDIAAPFALEIRFVEKEVKKVGDDRPT